jgi:hypothetical protein
MADDARDTARGRDDPWAQTDAVRLAELRADARRPMSELIEEGIALSRFASELAGTARRAP